MHISDIDEEIIILMFSFEFQARVNLSRGLRLGGPLALRRRGPLRLPGRERKLLLRFDHWLREQTSAVDREHLDVEFRTRT